ncbi:MAG: hypothetical protein KDN20_25170, partial [Verrucomicrobiae bacterium]|nr:hypothetical protein [Verrucomicrobiae bacterium]
MPVFISRVLPRFILLVFVALVVLHFTRETPENGTPLTGAEGVEKSDSSSIEPGGQNAIAEGPKNAGTADGKAEKSGRQDRAMLRTLGRQVMAGLGVVNVLDSREETGADGSSQAVLLVESEEKHPFLRVIERGGGLEPVIASADHFLAQFDRNLGRDEIADRVRRGGYESRRSFRQPGLVAIEIPGEITLDTLPVALREAPGRLEGVRVAEPDYMVFADIHLQASGGLEARPPEEGILWDPVAQMNS